MGETITYKNAEGHVITFDQGSIRGNIEALSVCMMALATGALALRLYARQLRKAYIGWDDYFSIASVITIIAYGAMTIVGCVYGNLGRHTAVDETTQYPVLTRELKVTMQVNFAAEVVSQLMIGFSKLSVLFLYKRIFRSANQTWFPRVIWTMVAIVTAWIIAFFFSCLFQCHPLHANWDSTGGTPQQCVNEYPMNQAQMYVDTITDLMILLIPIPCVWALHMPRNQKIAVSGMFLLGAITLIMSALKLYYWWVAFQRLEDPRTYNDLSWDVGPTIWWPLIEASLGVVGGCIPLYKPLFDDCLPIVRITSYLRDLTSTSKSGSQYGLFARSDNVKKGTAATKQSEGPYDGHESIDAADEKTYMS